jgi:hypothetical protein
VRPLHAPNAYDVLAKQLRFDLAQSLADIGPRYKITPAGGIAISGG